MSTWVDTDFGFDDLWAMLVLRYLEIPVSGVSLVAGNTALAQVISNGFAARDFFAFNWPLYIGADRPLAGDLATAENVLGVNGMQTRGALLPPVDVSKIATEIATESAVDAMARWLEEPGPHQLLALGPLTNIARLCQDNKDLIQRLDNVLWLGGSSGRGNHSAKAEFNAFADPAAVDVVLKSGVTFKCVDIELCRRVTFGEADIPALSDTVGQLLLDLLGGYLDIALMRGRGQMSIYDPLAALAVVQAASIFFEPVHMSIVTTAGDEHGRTLFCNTGIPNAQLATDIDIETAASTCLAALHMSR